jgi:hypothetical protein
LQTVDVARLELRTQVVHNLFKRLHLRGQLQIVRAEGLDGDFDNFLTAP